MNIFGVGLSHLMILFGLYMIFRRTDHQSLRIVRENTSHIRDMSKRLDEMKEMESQNKLSRRVGLKIQESLREIKSMENAAKQSKALREMEDIISHLSEFEDILEEETLNKMRKWGFEIQ